MKFAFMKQHADEFSIERMSKMLNVSRNGYYCFVKASPTKRQQDEVLLIEKITKIHKNSRQTYGSPRVHAELKAQGEQVSRKRVAKIMNKSGLQAKMKKRFKVTTKVNSKAKAAPNLLQQDFTASYANQRWVADMTYVATAQGWLYVAAVLDLFSRRIVGLAMSDRMTADLVTSALEQALIHRQPKAGLLHHSDRGCQYTSDQFQTLLKAHHITVSMSGKGNCYDNAAMESFFHTLKTELVHFEHYATREQARLSIFDYVETFYNCKRRHSSLGYLSPMAFESKGSAL
jgi:putative transposase